MAAYRVSRAERLYNRGMSGLLRLGLGPKRMTRLTVVGRKSGRSYTTPVTFVAVDGQRWLVAPYGEVAWLKNALAAGTVVVGRGRRRERMDVRQVQPAEAAPVLREYLRLEPIVRRRFGLEASDPVEDFERIAPRHPVLRLAPIVETR